jgi:myo-inositol 2-dehydrogenase / D-chiro-inositol 1-dehydrogenase
MQEDRAFLEAILDGSAPPVTADDGFRSVELVESVYHAIRTGERVRFQNNS